LEGLDVEMETEKAAKPDPDINGVVRVEEFRTLVRLLILFQQ
jgi:hypothetical protein